jgi:hypothetical protein
MVFLHLVFVLCLYSLVIWSEHAFCYIYTVWGALSC